MNNFSVFDVKPIRIQHQSRVSGKSSDLQVTRTPKNGNRITLPESLISEIGASDTVDIAIHEQGVLVGTRVPGDYVSRFALCRSGKRRVIYCRDLVEQIVSSFSLDMDGKTSMSFYNAVTFYDVDGGGKIALIEISQPPEVGLDEPADE